MLQLLETAAAGIERAPEATVAQLTALDPASESIQTAVRLTFDDSMMEVVNSEDESLRSALAMFDETPRWRRAELGLS